MRHLLKWLLGPAVLLGLLSLLGISAVGVVSALVYAVWLRPLPCAEPERVVSVRERAQSDVQPRLVSPRVFRWWKETTPGVRHWCLGRETGMVLTGMERPVRVLGGTVEANYFELLGAAPLLGSGFSPGATEADPVVVLSEGLWREVLGGDPAVTGQRVEIGGVSRRVVGVMPERFGALSRAKLWVPLTLSAREWEDPVNRLYWVLARVEAGGSVDTVTRAVQASSARLAEVSPLTHREWTAQVTPLAEALRPPGLRPLWLAWGAVLVLVGLGVSNTSVVVLTRVVSRLPNYAIKAALGCGRARLVGTVVVECAAPVLLGGVVALTLLWLGLPRLAAVVPPEWQLGQGLRLEWPVVVVCVGLMGVGGAWLAAWPAHRVATLDPGRWLKPGATVGGQRPGRWMDGLVIAQVGVAVALSIAAVWFCDGYRRLAEVDPGFRSEGVWVAMVSLPPEAYRGAPERLVFVDALLADLRSRPEVEAAAVSNVLPLSPEYLFGFNVQGAPIRSLAELPQATYTTVTPGYLNAMGVRLVAGRAFEASEAAGGRRVALINETLARQYFPAGNAVGSQLVVAVGNPVLREIVGVVGDVKTTELGRRSTPQIYEPFAHQTYGSFWLIVRARAGATDAVRSLLADAVARTDRRVPLSAVQPLRWQVEKATRQERQAAHAVGAVAVLGLLVSLIGSVGLALYGLALRRKELAIRLALGSSPHAVWVYAWWRGLRPVVIGVGLGGALAAAAGRVVSTLVFGWSATEVGPYVVTAGGFALVLGVLLAGCAWPGRRLSPATLLRAD